MSVININLQDNANCANLWRIIAHFGGYAHQKEKAIEELTELAQALASDLQGEGDRANITEEIADVLVTVAQLVLIYGIAYDVQRVADEKVNRTLARIEKEQREATAT